MKDALALAHPEKGAILYCGPGGTLEPTAAGKKVQSRWGALAQCVCDCVCVCTVCVCVC